MDTKSRKWKTIISFLSFFLGSSLLLHAGIVGGGMAYWSGLSGYRLSELMEPDYQNTVDFREYMQSRLAVFLAMAVGERPGGSTYSGYYDTYQWGSPLQSGVYGDVVYSDIVWNSAYSYGYTEAIPEEVYLEELEHANEAAVEDGYYGNGLETYAVGSRADQNLRYRISYEGKELYSNMESILWEKPGDALPEGYNFVLFYADGKVTIIKDGIELDIYGDGIYRDRTQWCLPGYQNLMLDEDLKTAEIIMLAAKEPVYYSTQFRNGSYYWWESPLYQIAARTASRERQMEKTAGELAAGLVLLVIAFLTRRDVRRARLWLGGLTGKIWFEAKLLLFLLSFLGLGLTYFRYMWYMMPYAFMDGELFYRMIQQPFPLLACFWLWYLLANDLRVNKSQALDGITYRFVRLSAVKKLSLSFSKRLVRRFLPILLFFGLLPMAAGFCLLCFYLTGAYRYSQSHILLVFGVDLLLMSGIFLAAGYRYLVLTRRQAEELDTLADCIAAIQNGESVDVAGWSKDGELRRLAEQLAQIKESMEAAIEARMKSERMKVELVANVSHDIKTPLTSIVSYIDFLKQEEDLPEHVKEYIRILDEKAQRLTLMVQDVFAVSKAVSGQLSVERKELDFGKLLRQTLADMQEQIAASSVTVREEIPEEPVYVTADGERLYRVFQNLVENALRYSLDGSRVYVTLRREGVAAEACVKNTSRQELIGDKDFTERFVRGDDSRTDGGSGLGLSIAKSFTEACGGKFSVETDADLFVVRVRFDMDKR